MRTGVIAKKVGMTRLFQADLDYWLTCHDSGVKVFQHSQKEEGKG